MAYKTTSFVQGLTEVRTNAQGPAQDLGTIRDEGDKGYKYVQYTQGDDTVACAAGVVVGYDATDGYEENLVTANVSDSLGQGAGVALAAIPELGYGWIQIWGKSGLLAVDTTDTAGDFLTLTGASDKSLTVVTAATEHICAQLLDDTNSAEVILCMFPR